MGSLTRIIFAVAIFIAIIYSTTFYSPPVRNDNSPSLATTLENLQSSLLRIEALDTSITNLKTNLVVDSREKATMPSTEVTCSVPPSPLPSTSSGARDVINSHKHSTEPPLTLVLYVTTRDTPPSKLRYNNLNFFIRQAVLPYDTSVYIVVIVQGVWPEVRGMLQHAEAWTNANGVKNFHTVWHVNEGFDFGAWKLALNGSLPLGNGRKPIDFDFFILLNGSAKGPFLPSYWSSAFPVWTTIFTGLITDKNRLVGTSVNCEKSPDLLHLQSMTLSFSAQDLGLAINSIDWSPTDKVGAIQSEFKFSQNFLKAGGNIAALQLAFRNFNFLAGGSSQYCASEGLGTEDRFYPTDVYKGGPGGITFNPLELVFFKANRSVMQNY